MKKFLLLSAVFLLVSAAALPVGAASLSPGLSVLAAQSELVVTGLTYTDVHFTSADFRDHLGGGWSAVTVTQLPPPEEGTLHLGALNVAVNQKIPLSSLTDLRFTPARESVTSSSFRLTTDGQYETVCRVRLIETVNRAPLTEGSAEALSVWTQRDISATGELPGYDPDGDSLRYEIVSYPEHGLLKLTDPGTGSYLYTPYAGVTGQDSFSYRVRDCYGHYSPAREVAVSVEPARSDVTLADVTDGSAYNAALVMVSGGYMKADVAGGSLYFHPKKTVSREDFLVTVMNALGADRLPQVTSTLFNDDEQISPEAKPYVLAAYRLGIIRGVRTETGLLFCPDEAVTRAEAAVILNRIVGAEKPEIVPVFADADSVPSWAQSAVYAMHTMGVLRGTSGTFSAAAPLTRAEAAEALTVLLRLTGKI